MESPAGPTPNKLEHECFPQPGDGSTKVWRYMDLAKFIWLLEHRKLHLSRLDELSDPHEGTTPRLLAKLRDEQYAELGIPVDAIARTPRLNRQLRKALYVNCWNLGNAESEAMWRLYCPNGSGIAIQTSYSKLVASVNHDPFCYVGTVKYIDYETDGFPLNNLFHPVMHKRLSFSHEREVRLVKTLAEFWGSDKESPSGLPIDWPLESTIESIFVNPYAPAYYCDVICSVVRRFVPALERNVTWSAMRAEPSY